MAAMLHCKKLFTAVVASKITEKIRGKERRQLFQAICKHI